MRPLPNGAQERKLRRLADAASRLWNELNYERRQQCFGARRQGLSRSDSLKRVDMKGASFLPTPNYIEVLVRPHGMSREELGNMGDPSGGR